MNRMPVAASRYCSMVSNVNASIMFPYIIVVLRKSTNFRPHLVRPALSFFLSFEYWYR